MSVIKELPELLSGIKRASENGKLAIFIGAGISRFLDCTSWSELAKNLLHKCYKEGLISFFEKDSLEKFSDTKKVITICNELLDNDERFITEMKKSLNDKVLDNYDNGNMSTEEIKEYKDKLKIYRDLFNLNALFITTNADRHIDQLFSTKNIKYAINDFIIDNISNNHLYKIHGSIVDKDELVFTVNQYFERYINKNFTEFLEVIFNRYTVLFIGYGLNEFELLDHLFKSTVSETHKHFFLKDYYAHEHNIYNFEQKYFDKLGVTLIPYKKDTKGYDQLKDIIENWTNELKTKSSIIHQVFDEINKALENPNNAENIDSVIQKMQNGSEYETYFFRNAPNYQNLYFWLKPLYKKGYFNPEKNPDPIEEKNNKGSFSFPNWPVLNFLESASIQNKKSPKKEITELLTQIAESIFKYRRRDGTRVDNCFTDSSIIKVIFNLPPSNIKVEHIKDIHSIIIESKFKNVLGSTLEKAAIPVIVGNKRKEHLLQVLEIIFDYKNIDRSYYNERVSLIENYCLRSLLKKYSEAIIKIVKEDGLKLIYKKINNIISEDQSSFSNVWIRAIEEHSQNKFSDRFDNQIISFTRDLLENLSVNQQRKYINKYIKEKHPIFTRLSLHIINKNFNDLKDIFWEWFKEMEYDSSFKHELYKLLEDNSPKFADEDFEIIIKWIDDFDYSEYFEDENEEIKRKIIAYRKKEWLNPLKEYNEEARQLFDKYNNINPAKLEHPGFDLWSGELEWVGKQSPIKDIDCFCKKTIDDIVNKLTSYKPTKDEKSKFASGGDLIEGLANDFSVCIRQDPDKFIKEINKFHKVKNIYKYYLIKGFVNAWNEKQSFKWKDLLEFINDELKTNEAEDSESKYSELFKREVAILIEEGTRNDENAFDEENLPKAKEVLFSLIENTESDDFNPTLDLVTNTLNSTYGKILHSLMSYSLRYGRLNSSKQNKWDEDIKIFFESELNKTNKKTKLIYTIISFYLPNLFFLDKQWIESNFYNLFPENNEKYFAISVEGYFRYSNRIYSNIYNKFKKYNYIHKALNSENISNEAKKQIINHVCVMHIEDQDQKSLFEILESKNTNNILMIIDSMWMIYRENVTEKISNKTIQLWQKIYSDFKDCDNEESAKIFSELTRWLVFVENINDEIYKYLQLSVKYCENLYNLPYLVDELKRLSANNLVYIGKLINYMAQNKVFIMYKSEVVMSIVEDLFQEKETKEIAKEICNRYSREGIYYLNDLINKYAGN